MKKLLSICFLSIFLMMFGMQAQAQRDCCFQLSNPNADTLHGIANLPGGNLPLSHYMSPLVFGATDVYDMIFSDANCLGIEEGAKVSVELELWCDGENILDGQHDLTRYCNITLQTFYEELHWVGTPMLQENYSFVYEYPGAIPIFSGTYNISNIAYDYFYFRFLTNTRSRIVVTWNQIFRDVKLIVHIRERLHGTDNSLYWNSHVAESEYYQIGGHQSHPGRILASDTLPTDPIIERNDTIKDCEPVTVGMPPYTMDTTGDYKIAYVDTSCGYRIDSIVNYNYTHYVHPTTPTLSDSNITYCQRFGTPDTLRLEPEPNVAELGDHIDSIKAWWSTDGSTFAEADYLIPETDVIFTGPDTTLYYYVKRHDNVTGCESEVDTFGVKITPIPAGPQVINPIVEYCVGDSAVALTYAAPTGQLVLWGLTPDDVMDTTYVPSTVNPDTVIYYLRLQDTTTVNQCVSEDYDSVTVRIFANPVVKVTADNDTLCFAERATLKAEPTNLTTYQWKQDGVAITGATDTTYVYTNDVTAETTFTFRVDVTEAHDSVSCAAHDTINILAYPEIGTPTAVRGDTSICGPGDVTREVAAGTNGTTARWYASDKTTVLAEDTLVYTHHFDKTDSLFVSSLNEYGCETPDSNWLKIVVTVDTIPTVVLSADNNAEVCAKSDMIIRSTVTPLYAPVIYAWTGTGLHDPLNEDSVRFNHDVAGQYIDTLTVTDAHGCIGMDTILVTVDTLPVIVLNVNYTIQDDNYCVGHNGEIIFTTPQYVNYSIDSGLTWQAYPDSAFLALPVGEYHLVVEDGNGCKNNPVNTDSIRDTRVTITMTLEADTNTHCLAPYGGSITLTSVSPATGEYHYRIVTPSNDTTAYQTDTVFTELIHGLYKVIVEDTITGCIAVDTITVPTNQILPTATFNGPRLICYLDTNSFSLTSIEPNVVFDRWDYEGSADSLASLIDSSQVFSMDGFPAGKHIFIGNFHDTVTHCSSTTRDTVRVNSVNISLVTTPDYTVCAYDTIVVYSIYYPMEPKEDTIVNYTWYNGNEVHYKAPGVYDTAIVIPSVTSNYISLVATDNHGCKNTFGKTMNVWPLPTLTINEDEQNYCQNKNIDLHVIASSTAPYTYEWMKAGTVVGTSSSLNINAGLVDFDVTLTVTDANGCISRDTVPVNVIEIPGAPVFTPDTQYYCDNNVTIIGKSQLPPTIGTFSWNGDDPEEVKTTGDYSAFYKITENGVSCYSDTTDLRVEVKGAPRFTVETRYNSETAVDTAHTRCYDPTAKDTVKVSVNPAASSILTYTYELNGVVTTDTAMVITRTDAGSYIDTIHISVVANYPDGKTCNYDTTVYYHLTINGLPAVPDNFPYSYNGGDSTIFYCEGGNAVYDFNLPINTIATYNGSATAPTTAANDVEVVLTDTMTHCTNTLYFDIVEVATPTIVLTSDLADDCRDTLIGKVIANVTPAYDATYVRTYTWWNDATNPYAEHTPRYINTDTVDYTFIALVDTIVYANMTINATSGPEASYSASCASNDTSFSIHFQPAPDMPKLNPTYSHYIDSANAAYCYDDVLPIITVDSFMTTAGAHVTIVGYTSIDTAGVYKVVANNDLAPYCPSDTLIFTVTRNREIKAPANFADYGGKIYYCEGTNPVYDFGTAENSNDSLVYFKGTTVLTTAPDTAGNYTLTIYDKASVVTPKCSKDFPFDIIEVPTPTADVIPHANWIDTTQVCEGTTINVDLDFTITPHVVYSAVETFTWKGVTSTTAAGHFTATPTADTAVSFSYLLVDTVGAGIHGIACPFTYDSTIHYIFYATPDQPIYTGDTSFCAGDTVFVTENEFTFTTGLELTTDVTLPDTIYAATKTITASVHYSTFTSCKSKDTLINIVRHELPTVTVTPKDTTICIYDTVRFEAVGATTYAWSTGETTDFILATDTAKYIVTGTDDFGCVNTDTAELKYFDVYTIKLSNDTTVCIDSSATIAATVTGTTGDFTLTWYKNDTTTTLFGPADFASGATDSHVVVPDSSAIVNGMPVPTLYMLKVVDQHGCVSTAEKNVIAVASTDRPQFEFREIGGTESIRYMNAISGDQSAFEMYIKKNCWDDGVKVFVDFQIYKNGVPMTKAELANTLDDYIGSNNTSYSFDLTQNAPAITYQTMESSNYNDAANFFPQSEFMDGTMYDYDWFWMHFISDRKITVNLGAWKPGSAGIYTFHYAVVVAGQFSSQNGSVYEGLKRIGGYGSHSGLTVKDTIAYDFFTIAVDTTYVGASSDFDFVAPAVVTTTEEVAAEKVDMNVYPNPASNNVNVVLTGVKGQTMITVHDMSGKAVSSMKVDIDDNGQIINLPVDNYSQGIYFIKVINGNAVMTKKLIIAR